MENEIKKILILSNLPQRDRATDELLASKLRKKGFDVRVAPFLPNNRQHILFYKPDICFLPEARCEYTIDVAQNLMKWGTFTVLRRTEGGAAWGAWDKMEDAEKETVVGAWPYDADLEIVWSNKFAELIAKHGYMPKEKLFVCGGIPFDLYFQGPTVKRELQNLSILFAPGWGHADRNPEYNVPEAPPGSPIHADAYNRHRRGREAWIVMMKKVIESYPSADFFLRLKTGESPDEYVRELGNKLKIVTPCPAKIPLTNCDLLIHAGSTLAIEAHLCEKPAFSYFGLINQVPGYNYPHVSNDYTDPDELVSALKKVELGKSNANISSIEELEEEFYGKIDGQACDRIAEHISEVSLRNTCIPDVWPHPTKEYYSPGVFRQIEGWICETCGNQSYTTPGKEMIKCPYCGIGLAKRRAVQVNMRQQ